MEEAQTRVTRPAGADLSAAQFYCGKLNSSGQIVKCDTEGERVFGIIDDNPAAAGRECSVVIAGQVDVIFGGTVAAGDQVQVDAAGKVVSASTSAHNVLGVAAEAGIAGDIRGVYLRASGNIA